MLLLQPFASTQGRTPRCEGCRGTGCSVPTHTSDDFGPPVGKVRVVVAASSTQHHLGMPGEARWDSDNASAPHLCVSPFPSPRSPPSCPRVASNRVSSLQHARAHSKEATAASCWPRSRILIKEKIWGNKREDPSQSCN